MGVKNNELSRRTKSKLEGEKAITSVFPDGIITRPSLVFSKEDSFNKFAKLATILTFLLIDGAITKFQLICGNLPS